jgi:hypothetical protein
MGNVQFSLRKFGRARWVLIALPVVVIVIVVAALLVNQAQKYIKDKLEGSLGKNFSIGAVSLGVRSFDFLDVRIKDASGRDLLYVPEISCGFRIFDLLTGRKVIRRVAFRQPQIRFEIDPKGRMIGPVPALPPGGGGVKDKPSPPWVVDKVVISQGALDFLDRRHPQKPVRINIQEIFFTLGHLALPADGGDSPYDLAAAVAGRSGMGIIQSRGRIQFGRHDAEFSVKVVNLDITGFEPYYQKDYPVSLSKGYLDLDMTGKIAGGRINASGKAVLKDLTSGSRSDAGGFFLGIPFSLLTTFLEGHDRQIPLRFKLEGDLKNPAFSLRENLIRAIASGLAETVGYVFSLPGGIKSGSLTSKVGRWGERLKKSLSP